MGKLITEYQKPQTEVQEEREVLTEQARREALERLQEELRKLDEQKGE